MWNAARGAAITLAALFMLAFPAAADDLSDGAAAMQAGDFVTTERLLRPLAMSGDPQAQYLMGMGCDGWRWPGSKQSGCGFEWYKKAAAQGHVEAQTALGRLYRNGSTEPLNAPLARNIPEALRRLTWAANRGSAVAQLVLGDIYSNEGAGTKGQDTQAAKDAYYWYLIATSSFAAHPELATDAYAAQGLSSLPMVTRAAGSKLSPNVAATTEFIADTFGPMTDRTPLN